MTAPVVLNHCLYKIDITESKIELIQPNDDRDFKEFSRIILDELIKNDKSKQFSFTDENELVVSHIRSIAKNELLDEIKDLKENWILRTESIAQKLLNEETTAQAKEGANKRGNSSRLTQSFHFFMFEPIFSPVNALNQPI